MPPTVGKRLRHAFRVISLQSVGDSKKLHVDLRPPSLHSPGCPTRNRRLQSLSTSLVKKGASRVIWACLLAEIRQTHTQCRKAFLRATPTDNLRPPVIPNNRHAELAFGFARRWHGFQCNRNRNTASSRCRNADRVCDLAVRHFVDDGKLLSVPQPLIRHYPCRHGFVVPKLLIPPHKNIFLRSPRFVLRLDT